MCITPDPRWRLPPPKNHLAQAPPLHRDLTLPCEERRELSLFFFWKSLPGTKHDFLRNKANHHFFFCIGSPLSAELEISACIEFFYKYYTVTYQYQYSIILGECCSNSEYCRAPGRLGAGKSLRPALLFVDIRVS
jgi:hypothetical protein